jgi:hypothetical protein
MVRGAAVRRTLDAMDRALAKRWLAGHEAAQQRILQQMREDGPVSAEVAFAQSMELVDLAPDDDGFREHGVELARAQWAKLRTWAASRDKR